MKTLKFIFFRALYAAGKLFSWRRLMLLAGVALLASSQSCRPPRHMCYDVAPADTTKVSTAGHDSLNDIIECYKQVAPVDSSLKPPQR